MRTGFTSAEALLHHLLDRHEAGVASPLGYPAASQRFASVIHQDDFSRELVEAEQRGAVQVVRGAGPTREDIRFVRLTDAAGLYRDLKRTPAHETAASSGATALDGLDLHPALRAEADKAIAKWSRNTGWWGLEPGETTRLRHMLQLAQAIVVDAHVGLDIRTFSRRITGNSKALETLETGVLRLVGSVVRLPPGRKPRDVLAWLGLEKFGPALLLSGPVALGDIEFPTDIGYLGIPPQQVQRIRLTRQPTYILTIENQTSFNRQVAEVDSGRQGLVVYSGGYPSRHTQLALRVLADMAPQTPFFHWSDIDADGAWIFRTVERSIGRPLHPHLMTAELARRHGVATAPSGRAGEASGSNISDLVDFLASPGAFTMEQEELDPTQPTLAVQATA